ncbi:MAG: insulinase family protein, partial [Acidimicrobiales bacterium]
AGCVVAYVGTAPARLAQVRALVEEEVERVAADGITDEELATASGYLTGSLQLSLEDTASRMVRLGSDLLQHDRVVELDEHVAAIRAVTAEDVARVAAEVFRGPCSVAAVGPVHEDAVA